MPDPQRLPDSGAADLDPPAGGPLSRLLGLGLGLAAFAAIAWLGPPPGLPAHAGLTLALLALMVIWWVSEAIPVAATALLPLALLPVFGALKPQAAAAPYADPIIYLFIGGFILAAAVERSGLHRRLALMVLRTAGASPRAILAGFMLATLLLSMWISNTATALMLMPIAIAVSAAAMPEGEPRRRLMAATTLGVAWCASIGGLGTPVGSPTNLIGLRWLEGQGVALSFPQWMAIGVSVMALTAPVAFALLCWTFRLPARGGDGAPRAALEAQWRSLGAASPAEVRVAILFATVALCWMLREPLSRLPGLSGLTDTGIALLGAAALFVIPAGRGAPPGARLMDWEAAERIPWGIAILFGGGLSMAAALEAAGLSGWIGTQLEGLSVWPIWMLVLVLVAATVFLSELASNVATLTALLPVLGALVAATGADPLTIGAAATFAASFGFMLPIATAANAIAFAAGAARQREMIRTGFLLNLAGVAAIAAVVALVAPGLQAAAGPG